MLIHAYKKCQYNLLGITFIVLKPRGNSKKAGKHGPTNSTIVIAAINWNFVVNILNKIKPGLIRREDFQTHTKRSLPREHTLHIVVSTPENLKIKKITANRQQYNKWEIKAINLM